MKTIVYAFVCFLFFTSCNSPQNSYEAAMERCMEGVKKTEFTTSDGQKGYSFSNFDIQCLVGAQLPMINAQAIDGTMINRYFLKDKVNVINFWFKNCKPCIAEIPGLNQLAERYQKQEVNFIAISLDKVETVTDFLDQRAFNFTHIAEGKDLKNKSFQLIGGYPTTYVTNKQMEIVAIFAGGPSDASAEQEILNKLGPIIEAQL